MIKSKMWLWVFLIILAVGVIWKLQNDVSKMPQELKIKRLLVNIKSNASFSAQEFAKSGSAKLIEVDPRNPFKSLYPYFARESFIVISPELEEGLLSALSRRYGYRYLTFSEESLQNALEQTKIELAAIPKFSSEIPPLTKEASSKIYDLMEKVDRLFSGNQITYWATAGTLLGAVRNQGLIPWDDDLDISIFDSDEKKLTNLAEVFEKAGLELHYYWKDFYKIYDKNGTAIPNPENPGEFFPFKYPFLDVFVVTLERGKEFEDVYAHKSNRCYFVFNNERFFYNDIANLVRAPFGPIAIPIPVNPEPFLNAAYGLPNFPDVWKKYAIEPTWIHETEMPVQIKGAAFVEINDFSPAPYS